MPARHKSQINLLPRSEFELSFWGRFLKWGLTTGRYIIIVTELVVIIAFLSRFKLDRDLIDLSETIEGQKSILEASTSIENRFIQTQSRLNKAGNILANQPHPSGIFTDLLSQTVEGIYFNNLNLDTDKSTIQIQAEAVSESAFGEFVRTLKASRKWQGISLLGVSLQENQTIKFNLSLSR